MMQLLFVLISLVLYVSAPVPFSREFCTICALFYIIVYCYTIQKELKRGIFMSFNILFGAVLFISSFIVPLFLYSEEYYLQQYMCRGSALVVHAYSLYVWGWSRSYGKYSGWNDSHYIISKRVCIALNSICVLITIVYLFLFVAFYRTLSSQTNDFNVIFFVPLLLSVLSTALLCNTASNESSINSLRSFVIINRTSLTCIAIVIISFLFIGDRTTPIYLVLTTICVYSRFVHKIRLSLVLASIPIAFILLWTVGQNRKEDSYQAQFSVRSMWEMSKNSVSGSDSFIDLFSDFYSASRSIYLCEDYVERNDSHFYPGRIVILLFNPFPYIPSTLANYIYHVPNSELSSGSLTTSQYNKMIGNVNGGMGTHVVADIYVSWGYIGVVLAFFLFGLLLGKTDQLFKNNIYYAIIYLSMFSNSIYIPRATLYDNYRIIAFCAFLVWIVQLFTKSQIITTTEPIIQGVNRSSV